MRINRRENRREDMKDTREEWYDPTLKAAVTIVDVSTPAQELARAHLCGPVSAHYLAEALAVSALLGSETSVEGEALSLQMKCSGPLGGVNVECTQEGTLRGYTEKKVLDDFDGAGTPKDAKVVGERRYQIIRSIPGKILSQGIAGSIDEYLSASLQRRARIFVSVSVNDEVEVLQARGLMVEALPDSDYSVESLASVPLAVSSRTLLSRLGLRNAELKKTTALRFACRCSAQRIEAMLGALGEEELASLPDKVDITCHMCGRTFTFTPPGRDRVE